jgi:outer membrane protein TolC
MSWLTRKPPGLPAMITGVDGHAMKARVALAATARDPRHTWSGYAPWIAVMQTCLCIAILAIAGGVMGWCGPAQGANQPPAAQIPPSGSLLTFEDAVKIAITQSPTLTKSSIDMEIRQLDETDSRYGMVPPLTFSSVYYVNRPDGAGYGKPYSLSFTTTPYNPLGAYFTLQAQKLATQAAVFSHLSLISLGLENLGTFYLQLDALHKLAGYRKEMIKLAQEKLTYMENRVSIGTGTSLEVKVAQQELQLARGEAEGIELAIQRNLSGLRNFLGLPADYNITPGFQDSRRQVLGSFNPATSNLEEAKSRSYDLKVLDIYKKLQDYHVSLAIAKALPTFIFNTQTPDPLSVTNARGLYVGFGIQVPVWDGFTRIRNISRQKAILKQFGAKKEQKEGLIEDKWLSMQETIHEKNVALKNAQSLEELARLKAHQQEVRYQSGEAPLPIFLESRREVLKVQEEVARRGLEYDKAVLKLREASGDLGNTYVDPNSWKK